MYRSSPPDETLTANDGEVKTYIGLTEPTFKKRLYRQCHSYKPGRKSCDLCLSEKLLIMKNKDPRCLNVRSELFNTCRHRRKFKLSFAKTAG